VDPCAGDDHPGTATRGRRERSSIAARVDDRGTGGSAWAAATAIVRDPFLAAIAAQTLLFTFARRRP
jgi:hypothetical protein